MFKNIIFLLFFIISCANNKKTVTRDISAESSLTAEQQSEIQAEVEKKAIEDASEKLRQLFKEAKENGEETVNYLASDLYLKATDASLHGDAATAAFLYGHLVEAKPEDTYLKKKLAVELIRLGDLKESELVLQKAYKQSKDDEIINLLLGGIYTAKGKKKEARKLYNQVWKKNKKSEEVCLFLSKSYSNEKNYKKADNILRTCEKADNKNPNFSYMRAKLALERNQPKLARTLFKRSLKKDESFYQAALALGIMAEEQKNYKAATKIYKSYIDKGTLNYTVLGRLVELLFSEGKFDEVIPYAEMLSSMDPSDLNLKIKIGIIYTDLKKYDEAIGTFKELLVAVPDSEKVLFYLGSLYGAQENWKMSLEYFNKISKEGDLFKEGVLQRAQILQKLAIKEGQDNSKAGYIEKFESLVSDYKGDEQLKISLGVLEAGYYESVDNVRRAISSIDDFVGHAEFSEGQKYYLASLYEKDNNFTESRKIISAILENNPDNAHALNFMGYSLLVTEEDMDKAYEYISKAVKLLPEDGYIRDSLGWYYYKVGKYSKALKEIKKALKLVKDDVVINKHLAIVYQKMQKYDLAQKYYAEALKNCTLLSEKREVEEAMNQLEQLRLPASVSESP